MRGAGWLLFGLVLGAVGCAAPAAPARAPAAAPASAPSSAASPSAVLPERINALYSSRNVDSLVFYVADRQGFWAQEGLDVALDYAAATAANAAQLSGQAPVVASGGAEAIAAAAQGGDVRIIAGIFNSTPFRLMAEPSIRTAADLRGKRIGITRPGSVTDMTARLAVEKLGLSPADVEVLALGDMRVLLTALTSGTIQAGMAYPPDTAPLEDRGFNTLYDPAQENFPFQHKTVTVVGRWAEEHPEATERLLRGVVRAIHFIRTEREATLALLSEFIGVTDRRGLDEAYDQIILRLIPAEPYASVEGVRYILEFLARGDPSLRTVDPTQLIDHRWLQRIVDSGFIAQLYGR
ncbi:MAG TPA: ABC transporter substrate-binding protein [Chloroflexota bacterium]|nr:ABC transporter substrate-binding protein [Chloroflexota bacterium]